MQKVNFQLSEEAIKVLESVPAKAKGHYVSNAIIEKKARENNPSISDQIKSAIEEHVRIYHRKDD